MVFLSSMLLFRKTNEELHMNYELDTQVPPKKRRNYRPGIQYPDAREVIALSPTTLLAKDRFVCEVCQKGFPREQNLQLHKRGHNMPWRLKQINRNDDVKIRKVYMCPDVSCVHHDPSHALGDLTGVKKHYYRKHCEKKYKCQKCLKMYAVQSDLKAHSKTCCNKQYKCDCGTLFSSRDGFISHRAFCDALVIGRGPISYPSTVSNHHPGQMSISLPQTIGTSPPACSISPVSQNSLMIKPSAAIFMPISDLQNHHKYQANSSDTRFCTNLVNKNASTQHDNYKEPDNFDFMGGTSSRSYGNGEGSSLFSGNYDTTAAMPQFVATALFKKAALIGSSSSSSSFSCNNFARSASFATGEGSNCRFPYGDKSNSNMIEVINPFSSSGPNVGETYEQQHDNDRGGDHDDEWNIEQQHRPNICTLKSMDFKQSRGVAFTRDFLGVGGPHI